MYSFFVCHKAVFVLKYCLKWGVKMESNQTFGEYLKQLRKKKGLTIKKLAELAGLSPSYLSRIERGERNIPNARFLKKLASPLNLTPQQMMIAAGYLNNDEPDKPSLYKEREEDSGVSSSWQEIIKDPALHEALEEIGPLSEDEKEGLLLYLQAIKLRRDKNR
jgi:transcriptional regulator with XRE-family HTH domain